MSGARFFVLRTPLLPLEELLSWTEGCRAAKCAQAGLEVSVGSWQTDVGLLRKRLAGLVSRAEIRQALFLASPSLEASIQYWLADPDSKRGVQTERSLVRYFTRMASRPTPFGLLAGCSVGEISGSLDLTLQGRSAYQIGSTVDHDVLVSIAQRLHGDEQITETLPYHPNSTLHEIGDEWHYVDSYSHKLVKVYDQPYLGIVIEEARHGATFTEICQRLVLSEHHGRITYNDASKYVRDLIAADVLVSPLSPQVTCLHDTAADHFLNEVERLAIDHDASTRLRQACNDLAALDHRGIGLSPHEYTRVNLLLGDFGQSKAARLFHTDLKKPLAHGTLTEDLVEELVATVNLLQHSDGEHPRDPAILRSFRELFVHRYGEDRWIPLLAALDEDVGIGFGRTSWAYRLHSAHDREAALDREGVSCPLRRIVLQKVLSSAAEGQSEVALQASDFESNGYSNRPVPTDYSITFTLIANSLAAVGEGDYHLYLRSVKSPSGVTLFSRYSQRDIPLLHRVRDHLKREEEREHDAVYAEIVHVPEQGMGAIIQRPVLREYELPLLCRSGARSDRQIALADLWVSVTRDGRIQMRSQRLNKLVIPRLTCAHSFDREHFSPLYRFLCYLQYAHASELRLFDWGPLQSLPFLPRLRLGRVILKPAQWTITASDIRLLGSGRRAEAFFVAQQFRAERRWPRWIVLEEHDNTLLVDLDNPLSVDAFIHLLKRSSGGTITELLDGCDQLCVAGPEGHFRHEIVVPVLGKHTDTSLGGRVQNRPLPVNNVQPSPAPMLQRTFPPGTEWLYVKVYGGRATLDRLLLERISCMVAEMKERGLVCWFYVRYSDPESHLRLRFQAQHGVAPYEIAAVFAKHMNPMLTAGKIWRLEQDTYEREVERYGGQHGIIEAERLFCIDSEASLHLLQLAFDHAHEDRLAIAVASVYQFLGDLHVDTRDGRDVMASAREFFLQKCDAAPAQVKQRLANHFRRNSPAFYALFYPYRHGAGPTSLDRNQLREVLTRRSQALACSIEALLNLRDRDLLTDTFQNLVLSFLHMHINRLLQPPSGETELLVYDALWRIYNGMLSRTTTE
jgi:thiopeptide-type bacteriocin biosynthesis protein